MANKGILATAGLPAVPGVCFERALHAVVACDERLDRIFVVTVYRPSEERWEDDWRTRK